MIFLFKKLKSSYHCCCCSAAQSWTAWFKNLMDRSTPGFPVHRHLPELAQTHVHWVGDAIQPFHPLSSPSPPVFYLSQHQGLFQWVSSLHQVAKVLEFIFSIVPSKSLLQPHSSKASILQRSACFIVQLSHPYMTTEKTIALTITDLCWQSNVSAF